MLHPILEMFGSVPNISKVAVRPENHIQIAMPHLPTHGVRLNRVAAVEGLQSCGAKGVAEGAGADGRHDALSCLRGLVKGAVKIPQHSDRPVPCGARTEGAVSGPPVCVRA